MSRGKVLASMSASSHLHIEGRTPGNADMHLLREARSGSGAGGGWWGPHLGGRARAACGHRGEASAAVAAAAPFRRCPSTACGPRHNAPTARRYLLIHQIERQSALIRAQGCWRAPGAYVGRLTARGKLGGAARCCKGFELHPKAIQDMEEGLSLLVGQEKDANRFSHSRSLAATCPRFGYADRTVLASKQMMQDVSIGPTQVI